MKEGIERSVERARSALFVRGRRNATHGRWVALSFGLCVALAACADIGDFGRPRVSHPDQEAKWLGSEIARAQGKPASHFALTDDETLLRNLAYPFLAPPYDRSRWNLVVAEISKTRSLPRVPAYDRTAYGLKLMETPYRSATARYNRLIEDVRDDLTRIDPFVMTAQRVMDIDRKREKSLDYVPALGENERLDARRRLGENAIVIAWVRRSLAERAASYRYALERLVVATPFPAAAEAERVINELKARLTVIPAVALLDMPVERRAGS